MYFKVETTTFLPYPRLTISEPQ